MAEGAKALLSRLVLTISMSTDPPMGSPTHPRGTSCPCAKPRVPHITHLSSQGLKISVPKPTVTTPQDPAAVAALKNLKDRVQSEIQKYRGSRPDVRSQRLPHTDDFARLARRICGITIGLVLGGGGARGISHLVSHTTQPLAACFASTQLGSSTGASR